MSSRNVLVKAKEGRNNSINSAAVNQLYDAGDSTPICLSSTRRKKTHHFKTPVERKDNSGPVSKFENIIRI
jgi:hypothetical protein